MDVEASNSIYDFAEVLTSPAAIAELPENGIAAKNRNMITTVKRLCLFKAALALSTTVAGSIENLFNFVYHLRYVFNDFIESISI